MKFFRDFSSIVRRMPGDNSKDGARPAFPLKHAGFTNVPALRRVSSAATMPLWVRIQKAFQPKYVFPHALNLLASCLVWAAMVWNREEKKLA